MLYIPYVYVHVHIHIHDSYVHCTMVHAIPKTMEYLSKEIDIHTCAD